MNERTRRVSLRVAKVAGWFYLLLGCFTLVGHLIRPDLATWPEVQQLGDAGGWVLDAITIGFGAALLLLTRRFRRSG